MILFCEIYLINKHLLYECFVHLSVSLATKDINIKKLNVMKVLRMFCWFMIFFLIVSLFSNFHFRNIFLIISKSFDIYGCCHPCLLMIISFRVNMECVNCFQDFFRYIYNIFSRNLFCSSEIIEIPFSIY